MSAVRGPMAEGGGVGGRVGGCVGGGGKVVEDVRIATKLQRSSMGGLRAIHTRPFGRVPVHIAEYVAVVMYTCTVVGRRCGAPAAYNM